MLVHDVMSASPVTVAPTTSVADLLARFDRHDFNAFPVVDAHARLVGVVSKLDALRVFLANRSPMPAEAAVRERVDGMMTTEITSVGPQDPLVTAGELMVGGRLQSLPVVERRDGSLILVGMVSRGDVLRGLRYRLAESGGADAGL